MFYDSSRWIFVLIQHSSTYSELPAPTYASTSAGRIRVPKQTDYRLSTVNSLTVWSMILGLVRRKPPSSLCHQFLVQEEVNIQFSRCKRATWDCDGWTCSPVHLSCLLNLRPSTRPALIGVEISGWSHAHRNYKVHYRGNKRRPLCEETMWSMKARPAPPAPIGEVWFGCGSPCSWNWYQMAHERYNRSNFPNIFNFHHTETDPGVQQQNRAVCQLLIPKR